MFKQKQQTTQKKSGIKAANNVCYSNNLKLLIRQATC